MARKIRRKVTRFSTATALGMIAAGAPLSGHCVAEDCVAEDCVPKLVKTTAPVRVPAVPVHATLGHPEALVVQGQRDADPLAPPKSYELSSTAKRIGNGDGITLGRPRTNRFVALGDDAPKPKPEPEVIARLPGTPNNAALDFSGKVQRNPLVNTAPPTLRKLLPGNDPRFSVASAPAERMLVKPTKKSVAENGARRSSEEPAWPRACGPLAIDQIGRHLSSESDSMRFATGADRERYETDLVMPDGPVGSTIERSAETGSLREELARNASAANEVSTPKLPRPAADKKRTAKTASPETLADALAVFAKLPAEKRGDFIPQQATQDLKLSTDDPLGLPDPYRMNPSAGRPLEVAEILAAESLAATQTEPSSTAKSKSDSKGRQAIVQRLIGWPHEKDAQPKKPTRSGGILNQLFNR